MTRPTTRPEMSRDRGQTVPGRSSSWLKTALMVVRAYFEAPSRDERLANTRTWDIDWDDEQLARNVEAPMEQFAAFVQERGCREVTRRILMSLYWEFVEVTETRPVKRGLFNQSLKRVGIRRVRQSAGLREYRYRIPVAPQKLVTQAEATPSKVLPTAPPRKKVA